MEERTHNPVLIARPDSPPEQRREVAETDGNVQGKGRLRRLNAIEIRVPVPAWGKTICGT